MTRNLKIRALMVTLDPWLARTFTSLSGELGVDSELSSSLTGIPDELDSMKYEAVLIDFDTLSEPWQILASVRESRSNKDALVFAVATAATQKQQAFQQGAHFVFQRPLTVVEMRRGLLNAYDRMVGERRRCFRCTAELSVVLIKGISGPRFQCKTMNISSTGMAIKSESQLMPGERLFVGIRLPDGFAVEGTGIVIWDDKHGKSGLSMQCGTPEMQAKLDSWLDVQFSVFITPRPSPESSES
ncbi:MAG: hypothetical protein NVS1B11_36140 [Terriglobales bacterium]